MTDKPAYKNMTDEERLWALDDFLGGLTYALNAYNDGAETVAAALSCVAALRFVNLMLGVEAFWPLCEAIEILEGGMNPDSLDDCRRLGDTAMKMHVMGAGRPAVLPRAPLSGEMIKKVWAAAAVECQYRSGHPLKVALRRVAGDEPGAAQRLEHFRENLKASDTAQRSYYFDVLNFLKRDPAEAAVHALWFYQALLQAPRNPPRALRTNKSG
jgi:hypothetical protein